MTIVAMEKVARQLMAVSGEERQNIERCTTSRTSAMYLAAVNL